MIAFTSRRFLAGIAVVVLGSQPAFAVDGQAFADRLKAVLNSESSTFNFGDVTTEGENVVLSDATLTPKGPNAEPLELGNLRFENVTGSTNDGWRVERVPLNDLTEEKDGNSAHVAGALIEGLQIKGSSDQVAALSPVFFDRMNVESFVLSQQGKDLVSAQKLNVETTGGEESGYRSTFGLDRFSIDTTASGEAQTQAVMAELGYQQIVGKLEGSASWTPQNGALTLDPLQIDVENAGKLAFSYQITGYTPSFIQSLAQISEKMRASNGQDQSAGMAVIGLISQLYLNSAELTFDDQSLTNKLLDYYAKRNNQTREQLVSSLSGALPLALSYIQNPDFQAQVAQAVRDFLSNPRTLQIAIKPENPVPATQIIGAAMGAPQTLPSVLNLSVTSGQ